MNVSLKPTKYDALVILAVLALTAALGARFWFGATGKSDALVAVVEIDGAEVDRFSLTQSGDEPRSYTNNSITLTVAACTRDGEDLPSETVGVRVISSDCPTQDCVHTGHISRAGQSIVCLPAHIVITLVGTTADYDVIAG